MKDLAYVQEEREQRNNRRMWETVHMQVRNKAEEEEEKKNSSTEVNRNNKTRIKVHRHDSE